MSPPKKDFAILCPIAEEWEAVCRRLASPTTPRQPALPTAFGLIKDQRVVCVKSGKGEGLTSACLQMVLHKWKPRKVLLVGVAGGFSESGVHRGDVVIARVIYNFEYGKVTAGGFRRRQEYDFPADVNLWAFAEVVMKAAAKPWKRDIRVARPDNQEPSVSEAHEGYVASSNKVVDDPDHEFFASVRKLFPPNEIHAVEMEGSGFGISAALGYGGQSVGCLMIRGISDEPVHSGDASGGTEQRRNWKLYAADVASAFACHLIKAISSGGAPDVESVGDSSPLPELLSPDEIIGSIQTTLRGPRKSKRSGKGQLSVPTIAVHGSNMSRRCVARPRWQEIRHWCSVARELAADVQPCPAIHGGCKGGRGSFRL